MKLTPALPLVATLVAAACSDAGTGPGDLRLEIATHRALWEASRPERYTYALKRLCFCAVEAIGPVRVVVSGDSVISRTYVEGGDTVGPNEVDLFPGVDGLFRVLDDAIASGAADIRVTWDDRLGYPTEISIDYLAMAVDDELGLVITELPASSD